MIPGIQHTLFDASLHEPSSRDNPPARQKYSHDNEGLESLVSKSHNLLFRARSVFPFDLFPDLLTIDENKVNIIKHNFIGSEEIQSTLLGDITNVVVSTNPFFASLEIVNSSNQRFPIKLRINHLQPRDALKARRIIQGLISTQKGGLDIGKANQETLPEELEDIGEATASE